MPRPTLRPLLAVVVAFALAGVLAACGASGGGGITEEGAGPQAAEPTSDAGDVPDEADAPGTTFDPTAERSDVDCTPEGLAEEDGTEFVLAHQVVDGELGATCFGEDDEVLFAAWDDLRAITPPDQLNDLAAFAGFASSEGGDEETLAYVLNLDGEGDTFLMAINLDAYESDRDQALLTVAHEFSHVFTLLPSQVDRSDAAYESCDTYLTDEGCFRADSLIAAWIDEFWTDDELAALDPDEEASGAGGEERCATDPGFFGPYAASNPEEDFAESFSAYVFDVATETPEQQARVDWLADQPGLVEFRERAVDADLAPIDWLFEPCG